MIEPEDIMVLQRTIGNRAVEQFLQIKMAENKAVSETNLEEKGAMKTALPLAAPIQESNEKADTSGNSTVSAKKRSSNKEVLWAELSLLQKIEHPSESVKTANQTTIQRTIGDGHDLSSSRFAGNPVLEACYDNQRYLKKGNTGEAVKKVQAALIDTGFPLPVYGADGKFGKETKRAVKMFQRSAGLKGGDVDGIIGPITMELLDDRVGGTPTSWSFYLAEGLRKLAGSSLDFPYSGWKWDSNSWKEVADPEYKAFTPKSGWTPARAIDEMFAHLDKWSIDCAMFPEIANIYAYRHAMGDAEFDSAFFNLVLKQHDTTGLSYEFHDVENFSNMVDFDRLWENAPEGTKVAWTNRSSAADGTAWKNENAVKSKKGTSSSGDRYDAHPLGNGLTEIQVKTKLAENASDYPFTGSDRDKADYVKDNIYRSQIQMLLNP